MSKADHPLRGEYDFAGATRGKFHRDGAQIVPPVHLEQDVLDVLLSRARERGTSLSQIVNELLKRDIAEGRAAA